MAVPGAKRLECVELAPAFGAATCNDSASELDALQTLRVTAMVIFPYVSVFRAAHLVLFKAHSAASVPNSRVYFPERLPLLRLRRSGHRSPGFRGPEGAGTETQTPARPDDRLGTVGRLSEALRSVQRRAKQLTDICSRRRLRLLESAQGSTPHQPRLSLTNRASLDVM